MTDVKEAGARSSSTLAESNAKQLTFKLF